MKHKLEQVLRGSTENHIMPFFWQHGEDDATLLRELSKIYESGIRAVCVESRPDEDFGKAPWFEDMRLILGECRRLGMEFWLLDDKHFPTGYAAGLLQEKYPHLGKHGITERHVDVCGPTRDAAVIVDGRLQPEERLIGVVACERIPGDGQRMTGRVVDLTDHVQDGLVFWDVPEGCWRIFMILDTPVHDKYIDMLREDSVHVLIEAVYEPHYRELGDYFGTTFRGFFSDEPFILGNGQLPVGDECRSGAVYPWNDNVRQALAEQLGGDWLTKLPALWFPSVPAAETRCAYMDVVTSLYRKCFSYQLGDWCRAHGVEYIGHIVEDADQHTHLHYFRALDGQDMAGIDVVLCQVVPGMTNNTNVCPCWYDIADHEFFHFGLAKLGSSHSHIQPEKRGRAMCEIFGAYGWAEGLPMMKWLADHMLVRGINQFVPHAFSPKAPDGDCPPHFYNGGRNPEFRGFRRVMDYMNRVSTVLTDGRHRAVCALVYHSEASWSGGKFMKFERPGKLLTEAQLDFDVVSADYLGRALGRENKLRLNEEDYAALVVPYTEILPCGLSNELHRLRDEGVRVIFVDGLPEKTADGGSMDAVGFEVVALDKLTAALADSADVIAVGENTADLRYYHCARNGTDALFLTNEGIRRDVSATLTIRGFDGGDYAVYDPMENRAILRRSPDGTIPLRLEPYQSVMLFFGDLPAGILTEGPEDYESVTVGELHWRVAKAEPEAYDPSEAEPTDGFGTAEDMAELKNMVRTDPRFAGFLKYETELCADKDGEYLLDLGQVGETAAVWINGRFVNERIAPPYRFPVTLFAGQNRLTVVTASHLGYRNRDGLSSYLMMEPVGLLGPVKLARKTAEKREIY